MLQERRAPTKPTSKHITTKGEKQPPKHMLHKLLKRNTSTGGIKKPHRYHPGLLALCEICRYQQSTENLIKKTPFNKLIKEISQEYRICPEGPRSPSVQVQFQSTASSLQSAAEGYMSLASHVNKLDPYKLPQVIAQIPPPPIDVPMTIRKALDIDGEDKVVNHLLHGEYEMTNTSWSKLQKKYSLSKNKIYSALKGKRRPGGLQY